MVHHIRFRTRGGRTRAWNLITLCVSCHSLVHVEPFLFGRGLVRMTPRGRLASHPDLGDLPARPRLVRG